MKDLFKKIILEFQDADIPMPVHRDVALPSLPENIRKAFVYIGMRRSGKTWCLYQKMQGLIKNDITKSQVLYINFEDDRLSRVSVSDFQYILDAYWELYPDYINSSEVYFFFDEIAEVSGWESFIRRLLDKEKMSVFVTGSSAKMLSKEIASSLRGRSITREIFPMSFSEYLNYKKVILNKNTITDKQISVLMHHIKAYLKYGGFPEVLDLDENSHREILQGYMNSVIYRDIVDRYNVKNNLVLKQLLLECLQSATGLFSINKVFNQFKSRGISVNKDSLYLYMNYFEDAYCLFSVPVYSFSFKKAQLKPKKIYPADTGLITAYSTKQLYDYSALLETAVFLHIRRNNSDIYYYHTKQGKEVDFLSVLPSGDMCLYQVCLSLKDKKTRQRELDALVQAMDELNLRSGMIITYEDFEEVIVDDKKINVLPLWRLLLKSNLE
jgi:uncharacterized protein